MATLKESTCANDNGRSTFLLADFLARTFPWLESEPGSAAAGPRSSGSFSDLRKKLDRAGCSLRTSPDFSPATAETICEPSFSAWQTSGIYLPTGFLTLEISDCPKAEQGSSLSDILENGEVPRRFFLSAAACRKILAKAQENGIRLPAELTAALSSFSRESPEMAEGSQAD